MDELFCFSELRLFLLSLTGGGSVFRNFVRRVPPYQASVGGLIAFLRHAMRDGTTRRVPPTLLSLTNWVMAHATPAVEWSVFMMRSPQNSATARLQDTPPYSHHTLRHESTFQRLGTKPWRVNHTHTRRGPATARACVQRVRHDRDPHPKFQHEQYTDTTTTPLASLAQTIAR